MRGISDNDDYDRRGWWCWCGDQPASRGVESYTHSPALLTVSRIIIIYAVAVQLGLGQNAFMISSNEPIHCDGGGGSHREPRVTVHTQL